MSPYRGADFFLFFWRLLTRLWGVVTGQLELATDEVQLLVLAGVAASGALVGTFLILRRMTMVANSLSHTILPGIVVAYLVTGSDIVNLNMGAMLVAAIGMGLATLFLTHVLVRHIGLQEDASNGLVFSALFALGLVMVTLYTRSAHLGLEVVMGNADALDLRDLKLVGGVLATNVLLFTVFHKEYQLTTFDPALARAMGIACGLFNTLLMAQVAATTVAGFRAVGVLMVLAFIVGPPLTARLFTHTLKRMLLLAVAIGIGCAVVGVALSRHFLSVNGMALSTGGVTVCVIALTYFGGVLLTHRRVQPQAV